MRCDCAETVGGMSAIWPVSGSSMLHRIAWPPVVAGALHRCTVRELRDSREGWATREKGARGGTRQGLTMHCTVPCHHSPQRPRYVAIKKERGSLGGRMRLRLDRRRERFEEDVEAA